MDDILKQFANLWNKNPIAAIVYLICIVVATVLTTLYLTACTSQLFVQKYSDGSTISTSTTQEVSADSTRVNVDFKPLN